MLLPVAVPFLVLSNMRRKVLRKKAWLKTLEITKTFAAMSAPLEDIDQYHQQALEKSITNWYSKDVNATKVGSVFKKAFQSHQLPLTAAVLKYHSLTAHYQSRRP